MGFGRCLLQPKPPQKSSDPAKKPRPRIHCESFYWDISSVLIKTLCLATFFVAESPRRIVSYIMRKPEPRPFFICSKWGYRMCACGHHYYNHENVSESEKFFSTSSTSPDAETGTSSASPDKQGATAPSTTHASGPINIKGGSFKDIIEKIAEQAVANQDKQSSPADSTASPSASPAPSPADSASKPPPPPQTPKKKKRRRRRWYWPF